MLPKGVIAAAERRGARAALKALKRRNIKIWVNSATPSGDLPPLLRRRDLLRLVDGVLGGAGTKVDNLQKAMQLERACPAETVMIGDGPDDVAAARELGTWFIGVSAEKRLPARLPIPCAIYPSWCPGLITAAGGRLAVDPPRVNQSI